MEWIENEHPNAKNDFERISLMECRIAVDSGKWKDDDPYQLEMIKMVYNFIKEISEEQTSSGFSVKNLIDMFKRLSSYEVLVPLTGEDDEWNLISEENGLRTYQNKKCSHVFKNVDENGNERAYDIQGKLFIKTEIDEKTGKEYKMPYTTKDSVVDITFPYVPKTEYVEV